jgi:AcrR family transcriptional regulator
VAEPVKRRRYDATRRRAAAEQTRASVLRAARDLFASSGYAGASVTDIARSAGVSVDTLYATIGRKPQLMLAVIDMELAEGRAPVAAEDREYVRRVRNAPTAAEKIDLYTAALARVLPRTVPLLESLREAGRTDPACRELHRTISDRRAGNMRLFAADLRSTGELRAELDDQMVADLVWSMNAPDYYLLVRSRGRTAEQYATLLRDVWTRTLLQNPQ